MFGARTPLAVGASDLDGSQVVEKFLEVRVANGRPPGVVSAVMESNYDNKLGQIYPGVQITQTYRSSIAFHSRGLDYDKKKKKFKMRLT